MDLAGLSTFIQSVGFPMSICIALLWFAYKYIVPTLTESMRSNRECTETLVLMNERVRDIETDITIIKDDVKDIKNKINL